MSLFSSVSKRLTRQFIAVIVEENKCKIKQKIIKNRDVLHVEEHNFDIPSKENLGPEVISFLNELQEEYDNTYIALFLNTLGQGMIPQCDELLLEKYHIDRYSVKSICVENRFLMYATLIDIKWADKVFKDVGLDFVFSPFLILDYYIQKEENTTDQVTLYILNTNNAITIMISKDKKLLYGSFFNVAKEENLLYTDYSEVEEDLEEETFDELDLEEDELEIDEIGTVTDNSNFVNNILKEQTRLSTQDERIIKYLSAALKEFYSNELYESEFINSAKIYDGAGINEGVMHYIENELLLDTNAVNISVRNAIIDLSIKEVLA
jgi:hypothetical protein